MSETISPTWFAMVHLPPHTTTTRGAYVGGDVVHVLHGDDGDVRGGGAYGGEMKSTFNKQLRNALHDFQI